VKLVVNLDRSEVVNLTGICSNREIQKIEIQNMNGSILLDVNQLKSNVINIEAIENGIYFVVIYTETGERTIKKLIINK
jgi:hypothetical protein